MQGAEAPVRRNHRLTCGSTRGSWDILVGDARTWHRINDVVATPSREADIIHGTASRVKFKLRANRENASACCAIISSLLSQHDARLSNLRGSVCTSTPSITRPRVPAHLSSDGGGVRAVGLATKQHTRAPSRRTQKKSVFSVQAENADGAVYRYRYEPHDDF
jgi:hypothetical protein